jgi:hypothetical protein
VALSRAGDDRQARVYGFRFRRVNLPPLLPLWAALASWVYSHSSRASPENEIMDETHHEFRIQCVRYVLAIQRAGNEVQEFMRSFNLNTQATSELYISAGNYSGLCEYHGFNNGPRWLPAFKNPAEHDAVPLKKLRVNFRREFTNSRFP